MAIMMITDEERVRREQFWKRVHASYAASSAEELAAEAAERAQMDGSLADGLDRPGGEQRLDRNPGDRTDAAR